MLVAWYWGGLVQAFVGNGSNRRRESDVEDDSGFGAISRNLILTCVQQSDIGNSLDTPRRLRPTIMYLLSSCRAPRRHVRPSSITPHNRTYDDLKIELSNPRRRTFHLACRSPPQRIKQLAEQCSFGPQPSLVIPHAYSRNHQHSLGPQPSLVIPHAYSRNHLA
jgi:hypothetical protein